MSFDVVLNVNGVEQELFQLFALSFAYIHQEIVIPNVEFSVFVTSISFVLKAVQESFTQVPVLLVENMYPLKLMVSVQVRLNLVGNPAYELFVEFRE